MDGDTGHDGHVFTCTGVPRAACGAGSRRVGVATSPDQLHGSACSLCILLQECILSNYILSITTCHARDGVSDTPEHSNHIYLLNSSLIGDTDTVAWLRATRCTGTRPHRASQAPIVCTASLRPLSLPFARALRAAIRTLTATRGRSLRVRPCPWILQATTMRRTAGIKNKMRTRVERREKGSDYLVAPPLRARGVRCGTPGPSRAVTYIFCVVKERVAQV